MVSSCTCHIYLNEGCNSLNGSVSVNKGAQEGDFPIEARGMTGRGAESKDLVKASLCQPLLAKINLSEPLFSHLHIGRITSPF